MLQVLGVEFPKFRISKKFHFHSCEPYCIFIFSVDGFLFLLIGTALYNQLIHLESCVPCVKFKSEEMKDVPKVVTSSNQGNIQEVDYISDDDLEDNETTRLLKGKR